MKIDPLFKSIVLAAGAILWIGGLRLFLRAELSSRRKLVWTAWLVGLGGVLGVLLSRPQVFQKFLILLALLPALGAIDVALLRSRRGWSFWIRACGFELGTVFGVAALTRILCDAAGIAAILATRQPHP